MASQKIRIYELAKELGVTNKEALALCAELGIEAKTHSSSIEIPQADRIRRRVRELGLSKKEEKPTEVKAEKTQEPSPVEAGKKAAETALKSEEVLKDRSPAQPAALKKDSALAARGQEKASQAKESGGEAQFPAAATKSPDKEARDTASSTEPAQRPRKIPAPPSFLSGRPIPPPPKPGQYLPPRVPTKRPLPPPPHLLAQARGQGVRPPSQRPGGDPQVRRPPVPRLRPPIGAVFSPTDVAPPPSAKRTPPAGRPPTTGAPRPPAPPQPRGFRPYPQRRPARRRKRQPEELEPVQAASLEPTEAPVPEEEVIIERFCTPQELGPKLNRTAGDVIRFFFMHGERVTATQSLTDEMIELFAKEIGAKIRLVDPGQEKIASLMQKYFGSDPPPNPTEPKPPVITVMGHVDHGKTLLLDRIRHTNVVAQEAGGITQHIGAYQIEVNGKPITFIDTPGHEAFTRMRARGAQVTDIVVLVVAADDGVMPQTVEAISHARAANVPIVVAINKIDKEEADPTRVMQQLSEQGLVPEAWGGDVPMVQVSALTGQGIDELLEYLLIVAEVEDLRCDPRARLKATVLEASLDVGRGPVATVIPTQGTLRVGDPVVAGSAWGRVKSLINDKGKQVKEAPPAYPAQVLGLSEPPDAGEELWVTDHINHAREIAETRAQIKRLQSSMSAPKLTPGAVKLEDIFEKISKGETANLRLVLKADVQGSLEALVDAISKLEREEVKIEFVHKAVGGITESDVDLAAVSGATVIGFNVRPDRRAREVAEQEGVEIRTYEIIYDVIDDIEKAVKGLLKPRIEEVVTGEAEVRAVFRIPKVGAVAGCYVRHGVITRGAKVRFLRDGVVIWKGTIASLKRFKDDVREVPAGYECGVGLSDFQDLKEGDIIETYEERELEPE